MTDAYGDNDRIVQMEVDVEALLLVGPARCRDPTARGRDAMMRSHTLLRLTTWGHQMNGNACASRIRRETGNLADESNIRGCSRRWRGLTCLPHVDVEVQTTEPPTSRRSTLAVFQPATTVRAPRASYTGGSWIHTHQTPGTGRLWRLLETPTHRTSARGQLPSCEPLRSGFETATGKTIRPTPQAAT